MKGNNLSAELAWFHVFKAMIDDGEVAKIGASAFTTYCVIKSHTNFATGVAFPSIETISEKSGISQAQVKRDLKTLEANGLLTKLENKAEPFTAKAGCFPCPCVAEAPGGFPEGTCKVQRTA